jgi:hypothetical protein
MQRTASLDAVFFRFERKLKSVIPAKAGIHAGSRVSSSMLSMDTRLRGYDVPVAVSAATMYRSQGLVAGGFFE